MKKLFSVLLAAAALAAPLALSSQADAAPFHHEPVAQKDYNWNRGHRLTPIERRRAAPVDYRRYRLPPPARGFQWLRVDNRFLLVGIGDGVIANVVVR